MLHFSLNSHDGSFNAVVKKQERVAEMNNTLLGEV
jgi:hypothetical protein